MDSEKIARGVKNLVPEATEVKVNIRNKRAVKLPPNIMVFQTFAFLAATKLKPSTNKVLMLFFASSGYENYIGMDVITISEKLDVSERSVVRSIRELEDNNIIIKTKHPVDKRRNDYFLNPYSAWKGNSYSRKKVLEILPSNQLCLFNVSAEDNSKRELQEVRTGKSMSSKTLTLSAE